MKQKLLKRTLLLLCALVVGSVSAWADSPFDLNLNDLYQNGTKVTAKTVITASGGTLTFTDQANNFTILLTRNSGNQPGFYTSSGYIRFYTNDTFKLSAEDGLTITKIVITPNGSGFSLNAMDGLNTSTKTWEGSASEVTFTGSGTNKWDKITITYTTSGDDPTPISTYTVTYDCNDGTSGCPNNETGIEGGASITLADAPTKTGYAFIGWNDGTNTYNAGTSYTVNGNVTMTAQWQAYTVTAQSNNINYGTVSLDGFVITASPTSGYTYASPAYTVSSGSAMVEQDGNAFTVTPSSDCTVTINFEAIPTHTATFSVNGETKTQDFEEGAAIIFPSDPADINGKTFIGWVTNTISGTTNEAPTLVTSSTMGSSDITYYAVFADVTGSTTPANLLINTSTTNFPTSYGTANTFTEYTLNGKKFQIQQGYINGTKLQWRASGNSNGTGTIYNSEAINKIQSIVLVYDSSDSNMNFTLNVGTSKNPTSGTLITPTSSQLTYTFDCSLGNYDYFVLTNGSGAGYLTSITINYLEGSQTVSNYCTTVAAPTVATPTFSPASGAVLSGTAITISCETAGAAIYYTTNGDTPTTSSTAYDSENKPTITAATTIKAIAVKAGYTNSAVAEAAYTITTPVATPTFSPVAGTYTSAQSVIISCATDGATIYYTTNGDNPTTSSTEYSAAITVSESMTIKAIAVKAGMIDSDVASAAYTINIPVINAENVDLTCDATSGSIAYTITNDASGALTAEITDGNEGSWLTLGAVSASTVALSCTANEGNEDRTATVTLTYTYDTDKTVTKVITITQAHPVVDYVTLPFNWAGGSSSTLTSTAGVTASGLGSDYGSDHNPYNVKFDNSGDYIQIKTNERPEFVTVGLKMIGGASASKITVQESADGESFTKVGDDLSISGAQNSTHSLTSTTAFASTTRYIRLLFTKGSNVGVGPITITKYVPKYAFNFTAAPTGGTVEVVDENTDVVTSGDTFAEGTELTISATAATGYTFAGWSEASGNGTFENDTEDVTIFTMPASDVTVNANFTLNMHTLAANDGEHGTVAVTVDGVAWNGTDEIAYGSTVSVTVTADTDWGFGSWTATGVTLANTNPIEFSMPDANVSITANYIDANISYAIIVDDDVTGGTISANKETAKAGDVVTLTATPSSASYVFDSWDVQDNSANPVTVTNNQFTMPTSEVIVTATFLPVYTVTYYIGGEENNTARVSGEELNLDTPSGSFAGWSTVNSAANPTFMANSAAVTTNITLYAIFVQSQSAVYELVEADQDDWSGDYLIAYSNEIFADGRVGGTDTGGIGASGVNVNPKDNLSDKVVDVEWGDTYNVTLEAIDASDLSKGYVLKTKDGQYNYWTNNTGNGLSSTDNKETAANYSLSVTFNSSSDIAIAISAGAVFHYNTQGFFRFYRNGGQSAVYLYKRTATASYSLDVHESVTVSSVGYATFSSTQALDFTDSDIKAYIAEPDGITGVRFTKVNKIPANTGVLLYKEGGATEMIPVTTESTDYMGNNAFIPGTGEAVASRNGDLHNYILYNGANGIGFYGANGKTVAVGKAYIQIDYSKVAEAGVKGFIALPNFDEETGISEIQNSQFTIHHDAPIYNLAGQRIDNSQFRTHSSQLKKGVFIQNGRKYIVK